MLNFNKKIVNDDHEVKTAAVAPEGLSLTLYVNKNFWNKLTDNQQIGLLKHESCHVAFFHLTNLYDVPSNKFYQMNAAMDIEINQLIKDLPEGGWSLEKASQLCGEQLDSRAGTWYYYNKLEQYCNNNSQAFKNMIEKMIEEGKTDDHSMWGKGQSTAEAQLLSNHIKSIVKDTVDKMAGNIPGELKHIIDFITVKEEVYNWRKHFRRMLGNSIRTYIDSTRYRPSKRFPDAPGLKTKSKPEVMVAVDTSGSIGEQEFNDFFSEIYHLYKSGIAVTVVQFDTTVEDVWQYKGELKNIKRKGYGGTCCKDVIRYYKEHRNFSSCIIFTDGYLDTNVDPCQQLIWVISKNGKNQDYPGKVIYIP